VDRGIRYVERLRSRMDIHDRGGEKYGRAQEVSAITKRSLSIPRFSQSRRILFAPAFCGLKLPLVSSNAARRYAGSSSSINHTHHHRRVLTMFMCVAQSNVVIAKLWPLALAANKTGALSADDLKGCSSEFLKELKTLVTNGTEVGWNLNIVTHYSVYTAQDSV